MKARDRGLRYDLAKAAIQGCARFVPSSGGAPGVEYRIALDVAQDLAKKALAIADSLLDELEAESTSKNPDDLVHVPSGGSYGGHW